MLGPDVCTAGQGVHEGPAPWLPGGLIAGNTGHSPNNTHPLELPWDSALLRGHPLVAGEKLACPHEVESYVGSGLRLW